MAMYLLGQHPCPNFDVGTGIPEHVRSYPMLFQKRNVHGIDLHDSDIECAVGISVVSIGIETGFHPSNGNQNLLWNAEV